ncbi:g1504 [Coccomyxa elongata]
MVPSVVIRALVVPLTILALSSHGYGKLGTGRLTSLLQLKNDEGPSGAQSPATLPGALVYSNVVSNAAQAPDGSAALEAAGKLHGTLQTGAPDLKQALSDVESSKFPFLSLIDPALAPRSSDRSSVGRRILEGDAAASPAEAQRFTQDPSSVGEVLYTTSNSWLEVNYTQLVANVKEILPQIKPGAIPLAMVKGNGYGLGVLIAARAFLEGGMQEIGVGDLNEALALRRAGITAPIQVCYQPDLQSAAAIARAPDLQVYVEDLTFVDALCKAAAAANRSGPLPLPVHIAVSTGAVREGVRSLAEALNLAQAVKECQSLKLRGIMTHHGRLEVFLPIVEAVRSNVSQDIIAHMASSTSGFFKGQQYHLDQVRLGTALYGSGKDNSAFRWLTRITGIKKVYVGDELGYSTTPQAKDMTIAVLDVGSIDGADDVDKAVVRGIVVPVVGDGGMNMHMLDVTNVPGVQVDDLVMLSGCCADDGTFLNKEANTSGRVKQRVIPAPSSAATTHLGIADSPTGDHLQPTTVNKGKTDQDRDTYDWAKQWYPLAFVEDLNPKVPHAMELLGQRLVLWRDAERQWRCFQDKCPHRLAPLSEGRIEPSDGTLMCSYHGWRFTGDGKCTDVPQLLDAKANAAACSNSHVLQGKVWVYGEGGPRAFIDSAAVKPALIEELCPDYPPRGEGTGETYCMSGKPYLRDLTYSWNTLVEITLDPSHLNYSHHGIIGDRNLDQTMKMERNDPPATAPSPRDSISMAVTRHDMFANGQVTQDMQFIAPCFVRWDITPFQKERKPGVMPMYVIPTAPGRSRLLWSWVMPRSSLPVLFWLMFKVERRWAAHLFDTNRVLDGDSALLHAQDKILLEQEQIVGKDLQKLYYMPTQADRFVAVFRKWLADCGGGGPLLPDESSALLPKTELLNHYTQHVKNCPTCLKALRVLKALRIITAALVGVCAMGVASTITTSARSLLGLPLRFTAGY